MRAGWKLFVSPTRWSWRPFTTLWRWDAPPLRHAIRAALAPSGASVVRIDTGTPIPQRPERLGAEAPDDLMEAAEEMEAAEDQ